MRNKIFLTSFLFFFSVLGLYSQTTQKKYWEYPREFDYPKNILHGTYDFDEWPGTDHTVVYKNDYYFNQSKYDNLKIDYDQNTFDKDDHEGYLKSEDELERHNIKSIDRFLKDTFKSKKKPKVLSIFAHPDDETILAGGLLKYFHENNFFVFLAVVSNGAASPVTVSEKEIKQKRLEYNAFGVLPNRKIVIKCDLLGVERMMDLKEYGKKILEIDSIELLRMNEIVNSKNVSEFGEVLGMDYRLTYGPKTRFRELLFERINEKISIFQPDIIITHGAEGEYGHYLHILINLLVKESVLLFSNNKNPLLFTCMPEYNFDDKITHYLDLSKNGLIKAKWEALKSIPEIYNPDKDFDKPWYPVKYPNGVFMKDYGYAPTTAEPPRYEYFSLKKINR